MTLLRGREKSAELINTINTGFCVPKIVKIDRCLAEIFKSKVVDDF